MTNVDDPVAIARMSRRCLRSWLGGMSDGLAPGRFRFCRTGGLVPVSGPRGQGVVCFAVKTAWHTGLWYEWDAETRCGATEFIRSFQKPTGEFKDSWLLRHVKWRSLARSVKRGRLQEWSRTLKLTVEDVVRAESRQSASTLKLVGDRMSYLLPASNVTVLDVRNFVRSLDWSLPWGAGSQVSHLAAFGAINHEVGGAVDPARLVEAALEEAEDYMDPTTGTWGVGAVSRPQRINGAMKMSTAYAWARRPLPDPERLIEYALGQTSDNDGCGLLDRLFVLHACANQVPAYRAGDIRNQAVDAMREIWGHRQPDGGFSFYRDHAQRTYYGALVSRGGAQGDMHGAVMLSWATAIALDLLGIRDELGWQLSKP